MSKFMSYIMKIGCYRAIRELDRLGYHEEAQNLRNMNK
jgi:hypothetical protein